MNHIRRRCDFGDIVFTASNVRALRRTPAAGEHILRHLGLTEPVTSHASG